MKKTFILIQLIVISIGLINCSVQRSVGLKGSAFSDINHIVHMGQSLGAGEQSLPIITESNTNFGNLKFAMGTHTWTYNKYPDQPHLRTRGNFRFIPLTAQRRGGEGETIANGMCDHLTETIKLQSNKDVRFLFSYAGQGGRYLRELDKLHDDAKDPRSGVRQSKGGYYKTSIDDVRQAKRTADSLKLSYSVFAITWMQGERNGTMKVNEWDTVRTAKEAISIYKNDLIRLKNDYHSDIKKITGQKKRIPFFTYQTAGVIAATAQLSAADQDEDMFMIAPTYMLPNAENSRYNNGNKLVHGGGIHLTADGERWLGELFGKIMRKVVVEKQDWQPLRPIKAWYQESERSVFIKFHVPSPPLVIDTVFLPSQGKNLGFDIYDESNRSYKIEKVGIVDHDMVKITLTDVLKSDALVFARYALASFVAEVSQPIKAINSNSVGDDGHKSIEIVFEGDIQNEFSVLKNEGVFYLSNRSVNNESFTNLVIRRTFLDKNGNTVLSGEIDDLRNNVSFQIGQKCFVSRIYAFGNIHDSDQEKSTFTFKDDSYGTRYGQSYPLYNWSVSFQDFKIETKR